MNPKPNPIHKFRLFTVFIVVSSSSWGRKRGRQQQVPIPGNTISANVCVIVRTVVSL